MLKHAVSIKWSEEDEGFIAAVPGVKGLSAFGKTQDEALAELRTATEAFFEALREAGKPVPAEETVNTFSGQLRLRLPKGLHAELSAAAEKEGVSLNTYIITLLAKRDTENEMARRLAEISGRMNRLGISTTSEAKNINFPAPGGSFTASTEKKYSAGKEH
jgi:Uncharacterized protein encoded in hypervariable junctions of pilus gene clusters